ncbi:MAG: hypothetical protein HQ502_12435 [Alphaproteobacteria bacterium]|nr:hypothetical protein [Alphaproteobacteria bacterium]
MLIREEVMVAKKTRSPRRSFTVDLLLHKMRPGEEAPDVALYRLSPDGKAAEKLAVAKQGTLELHADWQDKAVNLALGPNVDKLAELRGVQFLQVRAAQAIPEWKKTKVIEVPRHLWPLWLWERVCVAGEVEHCIRWPSLFDGLSDISRRPVIGPPIRLPGFKHCHPICDGIVEIYERVCCCHLPVIIDPFPWLEDLCKRFPEICGPFPEPGPFPDPFPGPFPGPDPTPFGPEDLDPQTARRAKLAAATIDPAAQPQLSRRLVNDLRALRQLPHKEIQPFLLARPHLHHLWCHCSLRKVGETTIHPDGSFDFCYWRSGTPLGHHHCTTTYAYKVRQWIANQWVEIYDGVAAHDYFTADELAEIESYHPDAIECGDPPPLDLEHDKPFVLLERIGGTQSHLLVSPLQQAESGIDAGPLAVNGGLVNPAPPGVVSGLYDQPWGKTLGLRLLVEEGMKALGAYYYRISVVAADNNGNPAAGNVPLPLSTPRSWARIEYVGGLPAIVADTLGPVSVNGQNSLYKIPYWSDGHWLSNQYHQVWNTANNANGRYLAIVEVFDQNGDRLRPVGSVGGGIAKDFDYLHWRDAANFDRVPFAALSHVFWTDNLPVYGDIEDLRLNHNPSSEECQFLTGEEASTFSTGFRAFHVNGPAGNSFMLDWRLRWRHGLNGAWTQLDYGTHNLPAGLAGGLPQESATETFADMLAGLQPPKCAFGMSLWARAKHTNGSRRLDEYDGWDDAAFALEIAP